MLRVFPFLLLLPWLFGCQPDQNAPADSSQPSSPKAAPAAERSLRLIHPDSRGQNLLNLSEVMTVIRGLSESWTSDDFAKEGFVAEDLSLIADSIYRDLRRAFNHSVTYPDLLEIWREKIDFQKFTEKIKMSPEISRLPQTLEAAQEFYIYLKLAKSIAQAQVPLPPATVEEALSVAGNRFIYLTWMLEHANFAAGEETLIQALSEILSESLGSTTENDGPWIESYRDLFRRQLPGTKAHMIVSTQASQAMKLAGKLIVLTLSGVPIGLYYLNPGGYQSLMSGSFLWIAFKVASVAAISAYTLGHILTFPLVLKLAQSFNGVQRKALRAIDIVCEKILISSS